MGVVAVIGIGGMNLWTKVLAPDDNAELVAATIATPPAFTLDTLTKSQLALSDQRGRITIVHFFATWCEPCRDELAALVRLRRRNATDELSIVTISVGEVDARVARFFSGNMPNFPVLLDRDKAVAKSWSVTTLPSSYVLDGDLKLRLVATGPLSWDGLSLRRLRSRLTGIQPDVEEATKRNETERQHNGG